MIEFGKEFLPLQNPPASKRNIQVETCPLDNDRAQIRAMLTDTRVDFEDPGVVHVVHCIVINLTIEQSNRTIIAAEFAIPRMAVENLCEKLPKSADALIGVAVGSGFGQKIKELYEGTNSCFHLYTLLQAIIPYLPQVYSWNKIFPMIDNDLPTQALPIAMEKIRKASSNSCHAWAAENGGITKDFKDEKYEYVLERIAPKAAKRWTVFKKDREEKS